ncbi:MAG TPA: RsmE family RNA methyltransferase [Thermoanaerobaculia bacterium]|nr:RsmE family RNA methyltransferase [Thermoanaerobaculia bacterium]
MSFPTLLAAEGVAGGELRVEGEAYRHLFRARRLAVGDRLRVVDGRGSARWGEVVRIDRSSGVLALREPAPVNEPAVRLDLLVPTLRPERASWMVEKVTELGVRAIHFLHTERAPRHFGEGTLDRLRRVAAAALEQCQGALLPEITGPHEWRELPRLAADAGSRWVLDPGGESVGSVRSVRSVGSTAALLVGPEGGWSDSERAELRAAGWRAVGLGPRVLRIETAAVVGAAAVLLHSEIDPDPGSG